MTGSPRVSEWGIRESFRMRLRPAAADWRQTSLRGLSADEINLLRGRERGVLWTHFRAAPPSATRAADIQPLCTQPEGVRMRTGLPNFFRRIVGTVSDVSSLNRFGIRQKKSRMMEHITRLSK